MPSATATVATPTGELRCERTLEEVHWEDGPVETWQHTDDHGHAHAYQQQAVPGEVWRKGKRRHDRTTHYPTLRLVIDRRYRCNCTGDPHWVETSHYECTQCRQAIEPAHGPGCTMIPTYEAWTLDGQPITRERGHELLQAALAERQHQAHTEVAARLGYPEEFTR